jgi:hypothetical protein
MFNSTHCRERRNITLASGPDLRYDNALHKSQEEGLGE